MKSDKSAKTYLEKLGFKDEDLYEKNHDELMEFLVNNKSSLIKYISEKTGRNFIPGSEELKLEYCIMNSNQNYVNGFIDLYLTCKHKVHFIEGGYVGVNSAFIIEVKTKINSFGAVLRELNYYKSNMNGRYDWMILFSNDDRYRKLFEEQDIMFITEKDINDLKMNLAVETVSFSTIAKYSIEKNLIVSEDGLRLLDLNNYKLILDKLSENKIIVVSEEDINNYKKEKVTRNE